MGSLTPTFSKNRLTNCSILGELLDSEPQIQCACFIVRLWLAIFENMGKKEPEGYGWAFSDPSVLLWFQKIYRHNFIVVSRICSVCWGGGGCLHTLCGFLLHGSYLHLHGILPSAPTVGVWVRNTVRLGLLCEDAPKKQFHVKENSFVSFSHVVCGTCNSLVSL